MMIPVGHSVSGSLRLMVIALGCCAGATLPAMAQIHGIPASATSLGPHGFSDGTEMAQPVSLSATSERLHRTFVQTPVWVPYFWLAESAAYVAPPKEQQAPQPVTVEVKITDERAKPAGSAAGVSASGAEAKTPAADAKLVKDNLEPEVSDFEPTLLVLRDGSRTEVRDYAIFGDKLVDLGAKPQRSMALATIDLEATTAANAERGVLFRAPGVTQPSK